MAARCHLGLGKLWARRGVHANAHRELSAAAEVALAIGLETVAETARAAREALG